MGRDPLYPPLDLLAKEIVSNLQAIELQIKSTKYDVGFWEIIASTSPKFITTPDCLEASGVAILLAQKYDPPVVIFEQINSIHPGMGKKMVGAVMCALMVYPDLFRHIRVNDLSPYLPDGRRWWAHISELYEDYEWRITHDEDVTHVG